MNLCPWFFRHSVCQILLLFIHPIMSDSLQPHWLQHISLPCPSWSPGVCPNSCLWNRWCCLGRLYICKILSIFFFAFNLPDAGEGSGIRVFSNESALHMRWLKYWSFSFSSSLFNEYSGLISFRTDWFYLLAVQVTLNSLLHTTVQKHQFFYTLPSLWFNSHIQTWLLEKS